jgi:hypothetical protein
VDTAAWIAATGSRIVGRGPLRRPVSPRLLAGPTGKAAQPARTRHNAAWRRQQLELARLTAPVDLTLPRARTRTLSELAYWNASPMERAAFDRVKQRYRRPDLG